MEPSKTAGKPTFIGIGAEKCATTWCWACLNEHPEICMGYPKELNYFNSNYSRGMKWYLSHFREPDRAIIGEISPFYMDDADVCGRIASDLPDVKILAVLRNPYERALSHLMMDLQTELCDISKVDTAAAARFAAKDEKYVRRSLYFRGLAPYFKLFNRRDMIILFYDDLIGDPNGFLKKLYASVGASSDWVPEALTKRVNKTQSYRYKNIFKLLRAASRFAKSTPVTRGLLEQVHKHTRLRERVFEFIQTDRGAPQLDFDKVFGQKMRQTIAEDINLLTSELQIPVPSSWIDKR